MASKNLLKDSKAYYKNNDYYEIFSKAEDSEFKVGRYLESKAKGKIVLDAGCGTGKFLKVLENSSKQYVGIDLSLQQLEKAKEKSTSLTSRFIHSNLSNIPLADASIDLIVSCWVLGTIPDLSEREKCLTELRRVVKPGGSIILVENDEFSEFEEVRGRNEDLRTRKYNDWILIKNFLINKKINTSFSFETVSQAKKCFDVIYGKEVSSKINKRKIEHKIIIFKWDKNLL